MNKSDNCLSGPRRKRGKKYLNKNSEFLQQQETPHKGPPDNDWEGQGNSFEKSFFFFFFFMYECYET